jgi:hypothetical protein
MLVFSIKEKWCCVFFQESKSPVDGNHPIRVSTIQVGAAPQAVDPIVTRLFKSYVRSRRWPEDSCEAGREKTAPG